MLDILDSIWDSKYRGISFDDNAKANCISIVRQCVGSSNMPIETVCSIMDAVETAYVLGYCNRFYSEV